MESIIQFFDSPLIIYNDKMGGVCIKQGNQTILCDGGSVKELIKALESESKNDSENGHSD